MADIRPPTPIMASHCTLVRLLPLEAHKSAGLNQYFVREFLLCEVCVFARCCDRGEKSTPGKESSRKGKGPKCQNHLLLLSQIFQGISVCSVNDEGHDPVAKLYFSGQGELVNPDTVILLLVVLPSSFQSGSESISHSISIFI